MTQDERWMTRYYEVKSFIEKNHRNPSKHRIEEHLMLNWVKHNRKLVNKRELKSDRQVKFQEILALCEQNRRKNQWE